MIIKILSIFLLLSLMLVETISTEDQSRFLNHYQDPEQQAADANGAVDKTQPEVESSAKETDRYIQLINQLRGRRIKLLDQQRKALASDDDIDAEQLQMEIDKIDAKIHENEEYLASLQDPEQDLKGELPSGLEAELAVHCRFDNLLASRIMDSSGRGNHGIAHRAVWSRYGRSGGSLLLDGIESYAEIPLVGSMLEGEMLSVSICVFRQKDEYFNEGTPQYILSKSKTEAIDFWLHISPSDSVGGGFRSNEDAGDRLIRFDSEPSRQKVRLRNWDHIVFTYDGQIARTYINGRKDKTMTLPGRIRVSDAPLQIGRFGGEQWKYGFVGRVDDLMIWDRSLTEVEVLGLWLFLKSSADDPKQLGTLPI